MIYRVSRVARERSRPLHEARRMPALKQGLLNNYDGTPHATLVAAVARANHKVHAMGPRR